MNGLNDWKNFIKLNGEDYSIMGRSLHKNWVLTLKSPLE